MTMALHTTHGGTLPYVESGVDTVNNRSDSKLLVIRSSLVIIHGIAMESSCNQLIGCWFGQEISGQLFNGELVIGQIAIQCLDDPIPIMPNGSSWIFFKVLLTIRSLTKTMLTVFFRTVPMVKSGPAGGWI